MASIIKLKAEPEIPLVVAYLLGDPVGGSHVLLGPGKVGLCSFYEGERRWTKQNG